MSDELEKIEKSKGAWMDSFKEDRPDLFFPESWSEDKKNKATKALRSETVKSRMFSSIPILCRGPDCSYSDVCPLQQEGNAPIGKRCPIEGSAINQLMTELMDELKVDPGSVTEVAMVRDLVNQEIQHMRVTNVLAQEDFMQDVLAGVNERTGEVIFKKELHQAVNFEDKILKRKKDLRNQMLATREAKAKTGMGQIDSSTVISNIVYEVEEVRNRREKAFREKLGLPSEDQYIKDSEVEDAEIVEDEDWH